MALSEEFKAEIGSAVESAVVETPEPETPETATAADSDKSDAETKVVSDDDEPEEPEAGAGVPADGGDDAGDGSAAAKPEKTPEPTKVVIGDDALTAAVRAGISLEEARQFPSEGVLLRTAELLRVAADKHIGDKQKEPTKPEDDPLANLPTLDPDEHGQDVIKLFSAITDVVRKQQEAIKAFQSQTEQASRGSQEAAAREVETWFDSQVKNLGEDFSETLGTGGYGTLDRGSPQYAKREAIADQVAVLLAGYKAAGKDAPPRDEVFDAAARSVLKDEYQRVHEKQLAGDLAKRSTQHIQRAGGKKNKTDQSPLDATAALLDAKFFGK